MKAAMVLMLMSGHPVTKVQDNPTFACGYKPYPPINCEVGACQCNSQGRDCHYVFICK